MLFNPSTTSILDVYIALSQRMLVGVAAIWHTLGNTCLRGE